MPPDRQPTLMGAPPVWLSHAGGRADIACARRSVGWWRDRTAPVRHAPWRIAAHLVHLTPFACCECVCVRRTRLQSLASLSQRERERESMTMIGSSASRTPARRRGEFGRVLLLLRTKRANQPTALKERHNYKYNKAQTALRPDEHNASHQVPHSPGPQHCARLA